LKRLIVPAKVLEDNAFVITPFFADDKVKWEPIA
jgi:hypothetical protein